MDENDMSKKEKPRVLSTRIDIRLEINKGRKLTIMPKIRRK